MSYSIVMTTCSNREEAESLAQSILDQRLAACVQLSDVDSFYIWDEKLNRDAEVRLLIKTTDALYAKLEEHITENHLYEIPEIVMFPIASGAQNYLNWIDEVTL